MCGPAISGVYLIAATVRVNDLRAVDRDAYANLNKYG